MRHPILPPALLILVALGFSYDPAASIADPPPEACVGPGHGYTVLPSPGRTCDGTDLLHADGTWENGYAWRGEGVQEPDWGSFAEGYTTGYSQTWLSEAVFYLTRDYELPPVNMDVYIYDSDGVNPRSVLCSVIGVDPGPIAYWPEVSQHRVPVDQCLPAGEFFVGSWGNWPWGGAHWYWAADLNGPGGKPRTLVWPGIGYPSGWQDPSFIFGYIASMGIGACVRPCGSTPAIETSWSRIKSLYSAAGP